MTRTSHHVPRAARLPCALLALLLPLATAAAEYTFSEGPLTATFLRDASWWDGRHALPGVYCLRFPHPERAESFSQGLLNGGGISYARVVYADRLAAYVITSTLPDGRTAAEEIHSLQDIERHAAEATGGRYRVTLSSAGFGPVVELQLHDVVEQAPGGPFPLVRAQLSDVGRPPASVSAHRLFVRGPDRFEVAVLGGADSAPGDDEDATALRQKVTAFADGLLAAVQDCTGRMPVRGEPDVPR